MNRQSLELSHIIKCSLCIAVTASIAWPVLAGQTFDLMLRSAMGNANRAASAISLYASDWDQVIPRLDNNGSCAYGQTPCNYPDWGDWRFPNSNPANIEFGKNVMFFGAVRIYMGGSSVPYDLSMGRPNWPKAIERAGILGLTPNGGGYNAASEEYYNLVHGQAGVNILAVDHGPTSTNSLNNRPGAPKGRLAAFVHPESTILATMESAWDWNEGASLNIGDPGVWPSYPSAPCWSSNGEGWTRYSIPKNYRQDPRDLQGNGMQWYGSPDRIKKNPHLQGRAMFIFADMHVESLTYLESEQCATVPNGGVWRTSQTANNTTFYPNWVPEIDPTP